MENQHRKITGYRELDEAEIAYMNEVKALAEKVGAVVERMKGAYLGADFDQRWVAIGATDLEKGFMALTRAIAKLTTF